jgi:hypothetical protein
MSLPTGRSDRRITKAVAVELARPDASQPRETAIAQNVSTRGMRVATEHVWLPGDAVLLSFPESGVRTEARVVYFQRMENNILDSSPEGFRLMGTFRLKRGQIVEIIPDEDPMNTSKWHVIWSGKPGSKQEGQVGLQLLNPTVNPRGA